MAAKPGQLGSRVSTPERPGIDQEGSENIVRYLFTNRNFTAGNPIANAVVILVGTVAILASVVVGFFAAVVLGAALLILAAIIGIRLWWLRRKISASGAASRRGSPEHRSSTQTIEGEYHVVVDRRDDAGR